MIRSNLLSLKSGTDLLGISGGSQKSDIWKKRSQVGFMEGQTAFLSVLTENRSFIGKHSGRVVGEGIFSLQKGFCCKGDGKDSGGGVSRFDGDTIANFLKCCGFNEGELERIISAVRDDSASADVKDKRPAVSASSVLSKDGSSLEREALGGRAGGAEINKKGTTSSVSEGSRSEKRDFICTSAVVGHDKNETKSWSSLIESQIKESAGDRRTETLNKGIRPLDNLINDSFPGGRTQHNISHVVSNIPVEVNEGDIKPHILIKQIAENAGGSLLNGVGRVKISLNPPHLGTLRMDIVLNDNKVQVILQVENDQVRHVLQVNMEQLKTSLHSHGLIVDNVNVILQEKSGNANYGFGPNGYLLKEDKNAGKNGEGQREKQDFLIHNSSILEENEACPQLDGHISLFA